MQKTHYNTTNKQSKIEIVVLAPSLDLADNIGSLFRICDAMGVKHIYFGHAVDLNSRKLKKASRSTHRLLSCTADVNSTEVIEEHKSNGYKVVGLELTDTSMPMPTLEAEEGEKVLLVIGNEIEGISEALLSEIPLCYHIDMYGANSSMNVIQATSIALYQLQSGL